ncbi:MBL fold metallo-hydrolase [Candidatus Nomurabacteria bacterium]|nr:MBL fold metallo-hydrolase [Candidatus Nomurabacteria bacterium]
MTQRSAILSLLCIVVVALAGVYVLLPDTHTDETRARVSMLDIGQGDSFLIDMSNGEQLLIDTGGSDGAVLQQLAEVMETGDRFIDVILITHPDMDHVGGLVAILRRYDVGALLTSEVSAHDDAFAPILSSAEKDGIPLYYVRKGTRIAFDHTGFAFLEILFPDRDTTEWETNTASAVSLLHLGEKKLLFMGDSPESIETFLRRSEPKIENIDVLKLGHHGSNTSSSQAFLEYTHPKLALISAGRNNRYGHPHQEVLDRLMKIGIPFVSTQTAGTYTLITDGKQWFRQ